MQSQKTSEISRIVVVGVALLGAIPAICLGATEVVNPGDGPDIWADWSGFGDPILITDFTVDFTCGTCEDHPNVDLIAGDLGWQIWSVEDSNPGDIGRIDCLHDANYGLKILDGSSGAGARHVVDIDLHVSNESNYSRITTARITGNLSGDVYVQRSASTGTGGDIVSLTVDGNMSGDIDAEVVSTGIWIGGDLSGTIDITDKLDGATLSVSEEVTSTARIDIDEVAGYSLLLFGTSSSAYDFDGDLILGNGVPAAANVVIYDELGRTGTIDLNNGDVVGDLAIYGGGAGQIIYGGDAGSSVSLASGSSNTFSGQATFSSVTGSIGTSSHANLNGLLTITGDMDGLIYVGGDLGSQGRIKVDGLCDSWIRIDRQTVALSLIHLGGGLGADGKISVNYDAGGHDANGDIYIGQVISTPLPSVTYDGLIEILEGAATGGDLNGDITVAGCHATADDLDLCVEGDVNGTLTIIQAGCSNQVDWNMNACN